MLPSHRIGKGSSGSSKTNSKDEMFHYLDECIRSRDASGKVLPSTQDDKNVLFNDALNTFHLRLYGVRHMVKDHSDSEKGNPLSPHRLLLSINSKGSFICTIPHTG